MGAVDGFKGAGLFAKIGFVLLLVALVFTWISYTCTGWGRTDTGVKDNDTFVGLWRRCGNSLTPGCSQLDGWALEWYAAVQALVTFGFFGINVGLFLLILYMFVPSCQKNGELGMACGIVLLITGVLYLIGVIVFGVKFKEDFIDETGSRSTWEHGYAFALSVVAMVLELVAGVLVLVDTKSGGTSSSG